MGRSQQRTKPKKCRAPRQPAGKSRQSGAPSSQKSRPAADPHQLSNPDQILALQRQVGNKSTGRLLSGRDACRDACRGANVVQRESALDEAREALFAEDKALEAKKNKVHEYTKAEADEKGPLAKKLAQGLNKVMTVDYEEMVKDEKGLKAIDTTAKIDRYLEAAFKYTEKGFHDYIGVEYVGLVLEQIEAIPGLYEKLGLLRAMEPVHAKLIGQYLGIPPLKGFDYEISTLSGGVGVETSKGSPLEFNASDTGIRLVCKQDGEELWSEAYIMRAAGIAVSMPNPIPVNFTFSTGTFDTNIFWSPRDFAGAIQSGALTLGAGAGISFGTMTFYGNGSKGSLTIDTSGTVYTVLDVSINQMNGYMVMVGSGEHKLPKTETMGYKPKIKVTEDVDKEMSITFGEKEEFPGDTSFNDKFLQFLAHALEAQRLHVTITGFHTPDKKYNVDLMEKRIDATRELILTLAEGRGIPAERIMFSVTRTKRDEDPKGQKDPRRDRLTKIRMKGTITVRSPDE